MAELSREVVRFITRHIESVEELEVLLLLRDQREKEWSAAEISKALRATQSSIELRLDRLRSLKLIEQQGDTRSVYPTNHPLEADIAQVAEAYRSRKTKVIEQIFTGPSRTARSFSDAFRVRKED